MSVLACSSLVMIICESSDCVLPKLQTEGADIQVGCAVNCGTGRVTYGNSECTTMSKLRLERMQRGLRYICQTGVCENGECKLGAVYVPCWKPKNEDVNQRSPR
ncbi:uncharacterized protein LOC125944904 isoform X2 [Dermacentor silvarum]|uniref:uncharacterized protein LOC125944904 isoform X2 n=1 Tax=Dermacentor silvarum TaxID=543639 RepID=UPI0021007488|nr:uncharacterized protein LOC125944904 isoform X2 [Dermacentor silvarum]